MYVFGIDGIFLSTCIHACIHTYIHMHEIIEIICALTALTYVEDFALSALLHT
jgi:hypothetical protein